MHEHLESVTYDESGEEITYAQPTQEGNPYFQRPIAGFRGENQINRAEAWIKAWSKASGNREKREKLMPLADLPMPEEQLKSYLDYSVPLARKELKSLKIPPK